MLEYKWEETYNLKDRNGVLLGWNKEEGLHLLIWRCGDGYVYKDTKITARPTLVCNINIPTG